MNFKKTMKKMMKMRTELRERVKTTQEEFDSVNQNNRPTLSEQLHGRHRGKRCSKYRTKYDPSSKDFTLYSEEFQ